MEFSIFNLQFSMKRQTSKEVAVLLHNIRSTHNVGAIFRTADAIGVSKIYLCGYTPAPLDRFGRRRKDMAKVALGAEKNIEWESVEDIGILIRKLKEQCQDGIVKNHLKKIFVIVMCLLKVV